MYTKACCCGSERRIALKVEQRQHLQFEINWQANIQYLLRLVQLGFKKILFPCQYFLMSLMHADRVFLGVPTEIQNL